MEVKICIGTSCHRCGAEKVVKQIQSLIEENNIKDCVKLNGSFCLGKCNEDRITVQIDGKNHHHTSIYDIENLFNEQILAKVK